MSERAWYRERYTPPPQARHRPDHTFAPEAPIFVILLTTLVVIWAGVLVYAATRPDTYFVQRATTINAPPEAIFPLLSDFRNWPRWSPLEALDPAMKRAYGGEPGSAGAVYEWSSNGRAGKGRMEIFDVSPLSYVTISVDFFRPFQTHSVSMFALDNQGDSTKVLWIMDGNRSYVLKVMGLFAMTDKRLARHVEAGLANLKAAAEGAGR